jgi:hypothetical protein
VVRHVRRRLVEAREQADRGVVDPDVDAPELSDRALRHPAQRGLVRHVRRSGQPLGAEGAAGLGQLRQRALTAGRDDDGTTMAGECEGGGAADAARGPSHDDHGIPSPARHAAIPQGAGC